MARKSLFERSREMAAQQSKGTGEIRQRLLFVVIALIMFRLGSFIPVPGVNADVLERVFDSQSGTIIGMFNMFSGGALERASVLALGIMPYISASIIIQLLVCAKQKFKQSLRKKVSLVVARLLSTHALLLYF